MKTVRCLQQLIVKEHGRAGAWQRLHRRWGVTIRPSSKRPSQRSFSLRSSHRAATPAPMQSGYAAAQFTLTRTSIYCLVDNNVAIYCNKARKKSRCTPDSSSARPGVSSSNKKELSRAVQLQQIQQCFHAIGSPLMTASNSDYALS